MKEEEKGQESVSLGIICSRIHTRRHSSHHRFRHREKQVRS